MLVFFISFSFPWCTVGTSNSYRMSKYFSISSFLSPRERSGSRGVGHSPRWWFPAFHPPYILNGKVKTERLFAIALQRSQGCKLHCRLKTESLLFFIFAISLFNDSSVLSVLLSSFLILLYQIIFNGYNTSLYSRQKYKYFFVITNNNYFVCSDFCFFIVVLLVFIEILCCRC